MAEWTRPLGWWLAPSTTSWETGTTECLLAPSMSSRLCVCVCVPVCDWLSHCVQNVSLRCWRNIWLWISEIKISKGNNAGVRACSWTLGVLLCLYVCQCVRLSVCVWACPLQFAMCWTLLDCLLRVAYVLSPLHWFQPCSYRWMNYSKCTPRILEEEYIQF